jgi:hypothetical protein
MGSSAGTGGAQNDRGLPPGPPLNSELPVWPRLALSVCLSVGRTLRPLTDLERRVVAKTIVDYLQLSNWVIERGPPGANTSPTNWPRRPE